MIPYQPYGARAWISFAGLTGEAAVRPLDKRYKISPGQYGSGKRFRFWLYKEYGAEITVVNKNAFLRFNDETFETLFILQWSSD